jgi:hypothetical protein
MEFTPQTQGHSRRVGPAFGRDAARLAFGALRRPWRWVLQPAALGDCLLN